MSSANARTAPAPTKAPELVIVADRRCARFTRVVQANRDMRRIVRLVESEALVNPEAGMPDRDLFSTTKTGRRVGTSGLGTHATSFDDHRASHREENAASFAKLIVAHAHALLESHGPVVLCAAPRMLGHLREAFAAMGSPAERLEVPAHLTTLTLPELQDHLTKLGALPSSEPYERL